MKTEIEFKYKKMFCDCACVQHVGVIYVVVPHRGAPLCLPRAP